MYLKYLYVLIIRFTITVHYIFFDILISIVGCLRHTSFRYIAVGIILLKFCVWVSLLNISFSRQYIISYYANYNNYNWTPRDTLFEYHYDDNNIILYVI